MSAELLSETIHRIWLPMIDDSSKTLIEKLVTPMDPVLLSLKPIEEMKKFINAGDPRNALERYRELPEKLQKQKMILLIRYQAAQMLSLDEYELAIEDYRTNFPNDGSLDLLLIDGYFLKKDYRKVIECIDRTNEHLGGDSWLTALKGSMLAQIGCFEESRAEIQQAITMEPDFLDVYLVALSASVLAKNNANIVEDLTRLEALFGLEIKDLTEVPEYEDFVKSPEFENWMKSRK